MRLMLDTNLWSYLGDAQSGPGFYRAAKDANASVVLPPSVLLEVARTPRPDVRHRIVQAMVSGPRQQLGSEAEVESMEVVSEVKRTHPDWLLRHPNTARVASLHAFWSKRVWRLARTDLDRLAREVNADWRVSGAEQVLAVQRENREITLNVKSDVSALDIWVEPSPDAPDWYRAGWEPGHRVEAWRVRSRDVFWHALAVVKPRSFLTKEDTTYADWVSAFVDLRRMTGNPVEFTRLWLDEVDRVAMPRMWLRWACDMAQYTTKVTGGNPYDAQHVAYLLDCDVFLTADRRYYDALRLVGKAAEFPLCRVRHVKWPNTRPLVEAIIDAATGTG
jgi:hypothetical protein